MMVDGEQYSNNASSSQSFGFGTLPSESSSHLHFILLPPSSMSDDADAPNGFDKRLAQRISQKKSEQASTSNPLEFKADNPKGQHGGNIPNTPLAASLVSFLLGGVFFFGLSLVASGGYGGYWWWSTWQLGFFISAWSAFHWAEFAVTAGWNRERCNVDCKAFAFGCLLRNV